MTSILLISAGGVLGVLARFGVVSLAAWLLGNPTPQQGGFPWGTLAANLAGCLAIGLLAGWLDIRGILRDDLRQALVVGLLGGFTTFSSFAIETLQLLNHRGPGEAAAYLLASVAGGIALAGAGLFYMRGQTA